MPSSPVPFIAPSALVTLQHDLKARISSSPLLKMPLTMRPLMKKRSSIPFSLKRRSTTISSRSSSSSVLSSDRSPTTSPAPDMVDPVTITYMATVSPQQLSPVSITPRIGAKIVDRFWPEEEYYSEESYRKPGCSRQPATLSPPPHYRRVAHGFTSVHDVPFSDEFPSRPSPEHDSAPLRFPF
ncbi:hypothetical protein BS17DRAFT_354198 [Gyrodon lividus]|nr:hypothetical protein BS17DRAFT_354198 [Gyrodon lividus]